MTSVRETSDAADNAVPGLPCGPCGPTPPAAEVTTSEDPMLPTILLPDTVAEIGLESIVAVITGPPPPLQIEQSFGRHPVRPTQVASRMTRPRETPFVSP